MATKKDLGKNVAEELAASMESGADDAYAEYAKGIDTYGEGMKAAIDNYAALQKKTANDALDITVSKLENEKNTAEQDYQKEQGAAYVDWKKQSDPYGVNAEKMADAGLSRSGYSESSQVRMYTAYQNRVAVARESYNRAVADYNIAIAEAKSQNSAILAEIAYNAMVNRLELSMDILTKKLALYESGGMTIYGDSSDNIQVGGTSGTSAPTIAPTNGARGKTFQAIAEVLAAQKKNVPEEEPAAPFGAGSALFPKWNKQVR